MKKAKITRFGDPVLREESQHVNVFHKKLHALIDTMSYTLSKEYNGAALAANQISVTKRITIINYLDEYHEMINPEIISFSGEQIDYEGCLSFPGYSGKVKRAENITVKFQDRNGKEIIIERSGRMARCIQHEIDHLNGILFIDRMDDDFLIHDENQTRIPVRDLQRLTQKK